MELVLEAEFGIERIRSNRKAVFIREDFAKGRATNPTEASAIL